MGKQLAKPVFLSLAGIILWVAAIRVPLLGIPFERDEGEYAYIAWRHGFHELPYRDWIDQKPPGIFWIYQVALHLPMEPVQAVHLLGLIFSAASAVTLFVLASHFTKRFWALLSAVLFGLLSVDPLVQGTAANTELFMVLPLLLSQVALLSAVSATRHKIPLAVTAGALTGLAIAFKQVAIGNWAFLIFAHWLLASGTGRLRRTFGFALWSFLGVAVVWAFILGYFLCQNSLKDLIYSVFTHNLDYVRAIPWAERFHNCGFTLRLLSRSQQVIWLFSLAGLAWLGWTKRVKTLLFLTGWMLASFAGVSASGYYFQHYFQPLLPVLSIAAVLGAEGFANAGIWQSAPHWSRRITLVALLVLLPILVEYPFIFVYSPREAVREIYPDNEFFAEMPDLGKRMAQITRPNDRVLIFGAEPELLFYARRASATRYIFLFPLYGPYSDAKTKQMETANEVFTHQPAAALYLPNGLFFIQGAEQYFTTWSQSYLRENFHADTYLCQDQSKMVHLLPQDQSPSAGEDPHTIGALLVRNHK